MGQSALLFLHQRRFADMEQKPLSPKNDFVFHKVFSENMAALSGFLQAVLDLPIEEYQGIEVVDPHLDREYIDDKLGVLDIKIHTSTKKIIDVEIQVRRQQSIWKRLLFYSAKLLLEQIKRGNKYEQINRVITIYIADHILIKENDVYHNRFRLYDENTRIHFPDSMEINILEIPKAREPDGSQLGNWMRFFSAKTEDDFMSVAQTNPAIAEALGVIKVLSGDERARALAEAREKARMDFEDNYDGAYQEGEQKGLQKGLQKGRQEGLQEGVYTVAKNALRKKMPLEDIADLTGLSLEEVKRLAADLPE
jgi:predicted transposase/invertase (TIGR01784 family)